jgi:predicted DNA-binding transcriptional regulator AlpA
MNLTINQVSKLTKLSVPTLYVYASRNRLGKKVGNKRVFSQADVQKLLNKSKKPAAKKEAKIPTKRTRKPPAKAVPVASSKAKAVTASSKSIKSTKPSLWTRLFGGRRQQKKVGLMDMKKNK